jgi:hypothetical protein
MSNKMLEQAIIDANALKEVALKNAEAAVVEKYSQQIKEAVDNMLEQDEEELDLGAPIGGEEEVAIGPDVGDQIPLAATDGEKLCPCPEEEEAIEIDFDDLQNMMQAVDGDESPTSGPTPEEVLPPALEEEVTLEEDEDEVMFELDDLVGEGSFFDDATEEESAEADQTAAASLEEDSGEKEAEHEADNAASDATRLAHTRGRHKRDLEKDMEYDERHIALKESKKKVLRDNATLSKTNSKVLARNKNLISENTTLKENQNKLLGENKGFRTLLEKLSHTLESVNLSNAKLIYTNQILGSNSLNERQKMKIVESINDADSVETAKAVFETLQSAVGSSPDDGPKSLSEVVSNNRATMFKRTEKKQGKTDPYSNRMKKLAGI